MSRHGIGRVHSEFKVDPFFFVAGAYIHILNSLRSVMDIDERKVNKHGFLPPCVMFRREWNIVWCLISCSWLFLTTVHSSDARNGLLRIF